MPASTMTRVVKSAAGVFLLASIACSLNPLKERQKYLDRADNYFARSKFQEAVIEYRNAVQKDGVYAPARAKLAAAYERLGQLQEALAEYIRAADLDPQNVRYQLSAGRYLLAAARYDDALARAEKALRIEPQNVDALVLHGNSLAHLKEFDRALADIEEAIRIDPENGTSYANLGAVQLAHGNRPEAEASLKKAIELAPKWVNGYLALGNYYWALARRNDAERSYAAALKVSEMDPMANRAMAALLMATGRAPQAETYVKRVVEALPSNRTMTALADYYESIGRTGDVVRVLEPVVKSSPGFHAASDRLALAYAASGRRDKAYEIANTRLSRSSTDAATLLLKGKLLLGDNKRIEALENIQAAANADASNVEARFLLGKLYASRGDTSAAVQAFTGVLALNPQAVAAQVELSKAYLVGGNAQESLRVAQDAARVAQGSLVVRLNLLHNMIAAGQPDAADVEVRKLLIQYPQSAAVLVQSGLLAAQQKKPGVARAQFTRALELDSTSIEAVAGLVGLDLDMRDFAAAKARVDRLTAENGTKPVLLLLAARTYGVAGDLDGAQRFLTRAVETDPTFLPAYSLMAQMYTRQGKLDAARQEFDRLAQHQSKPVAALTASGMLLEAQGNTAEARVRYERALTVDPRASVAANNLAWIMAENGGDLNQALQLAQSATSATPDVPEIMDTLGWVYLKKDLPALAIPLFERSAEKQPANATYPYHLGLALSRTGDADKAKTAFDRALKASPSAEQRTDIQKAAAQIARRGND